MASTIDRAQGWMNEINITQSKEEEFQQAFANPLMYDELDITSRSHADYVFDKMPVWNEQNSLTAADDQQIDFQINSPTPVLINTICFSIRVQVTGLPVAADYQVLPIADFFNHLFNCVNVNVGQNSCNIDHLDTYNDIFGYVFKRLFNDEDYHNHMGQVDGFIPDDADHYQLEANVVPETNRKGRQRVNRLFQFKVDGNACLRGIFKPANLFFQKRKILAPYVPIRFTLKRNVPTVLLKTTTADVAPTIRITDAKIRFMTFNIKAGVYDTFREQYDKNKTRFPPLDMPVNPYTNPSAIYEYLDVRASQFTIPQGVQTITQPIRFNSNTPKAIWFCFTNKQKLLAAQNHLEFSLARLKSYSILRDSQPVVSCAVVRHQNCSAEFQDMYMRVRNMLDHYLTNETNSLSYIDFEGGAGILCENLNFANNFFIPARQDVGNIELKLEFTAATEAAYSCYTFLIYDQKLIIDESFNAHLITSV